MTLTLLLDLDLLCGSLSSLLPYAYHPSVAELCIKYKVNMVTASYLSKPMMDLHDQ